MEKTVKVIVDVNDEIEAKVWDLEIVENSITTALENGLIEIPDVTNDPVRLALIAMKYIREELTKQSERLKSLRDELKAEGESSK